MRSSTICSLAVFAFALLLSQTEAKFYKDYSSINSRVPGDQLLFHSTHAIQKLDFYAKVAIEVRYPENQPNSNYILSHVLVTGQDDTGYLSTRFDDGGPGTDHMRLKIMFESIQNGDFEVFLYGKKK